MSTSTIDIDELFRDDPKVLTILKEVETSPSLYKKASAAHPKVDTPTSPNIAFPPQDNYNPSGKIEKPEQLSGFSASQISAVTQNKVRRKSHVMTFISNLIFYEGIIILLLSAVAFAQSNSPDKQLFGYRYYNVLTTSMQSEIPKGSFAFVKIVDKNIIKEGGG